MERQHTENLLRRHKGKLVNIKTISGGVYRGCVNEITNDYVSLIDRDSDDQTQTFVLFEAMESFVITDPPSAK
jgi:ferredoxin-fold anticodon binding domain-containing protein